jgi:hypothetical protein
VRAPNPKADAKKVEASPSSLPSCSEGRNSSLSSQGKPSRKCWKASKKLMKMVVEDDMSMGVIPKLMGKIVVGRFCSKVVCRKALGN